MKIINGDAQLRQCIPNTFATVSGEPRWYDKLFTYLDAAEQWLAMNVTSQEVIDSLEHQPETNPLKRISAKIITCQALMGGIPSLDLVLTPNGFGIVNTGNIAPASKDRVERLLASVERERDMAINEMVKRLGADNAAWLSSGPGLFFSSTLFPDLDVCAKMGEKDHLFDYYRSIHTRLITIETTLAETYFSKELMCRLHLVAIRNTPVNTIVADVLKGIRSIELLLLADRQVRQQEYFDIVETIKSSPDNFPEWFASSTSRLFKPQVFENEKSSTGYWF